MISSSAQVRQLAGYCLEAGNAGLPYLFAASGLALGAGALLGDSPVAGACGAVAGVTSGLLATSRTAFYRRQAAAMRERLRQQRAAADTTSSGLRARISALEVTLWERQVLAPPAEPEGAAQPDAVAEPEPVVVEQAAAPLVPQPDGRPGLRLAYAAARLTVPRGVLAAAVATTGSLSLADIAAAAERAAAERAARQEPETAEMPRPVLPQAQPDRAQPDRVEPAEVEPAEVEPAEIETADATMTEAELTEAELREAELTEAEQREPAVTAA